MIVMPKRYDVFDDMFSSFTPRNFQMDNFMKCDIHEKDGYYLFDIDLPGYKKEEVFLDINRGYLTIKAEHNMSEEEKNEKGEIVREERSFGLASRSFFVGRGIKAEDVKAKFDNGVLSICLPTRETKRIETSEQITIE